MQASTSATSCDELLQSAADPNSLLHNVYLLLEIRKHKKEMADQRVQRCKLELAKKLTSIQNEASDSITHSTTRNSLGSSNRGAGDSYKSEEKRVSFPPGDSKTASRHSAVSKKSSVGIKNAPSSASPDVAVISDLFSVVELLGKYYNISSDEEFRRNRDQLMQTLSLLKNYKSFDNILIQYIKKLKNLYDLQRRFGDVIGEEVSTVYSTENL